MIFCQQRKIQTWEVQKMLKGRDLEELSYEEKQKMAAKLYRKGFGVSNIRKSTGL